jgi:hypothetical protein
VVVLVEVVEVVVLVEVVVSERAVDNILEVGRWWSWGEHIVVKVVEASRWSLCWLRW